MNNIQLILCGSIAVDHIMSFTGRYSDLLQPDKLDVISLSVLVDDRKDVPGGNGANIAAVIAGLGEHPILLASVGKDQLVYKQRLADLGVVTDFIHESDLPTASFTVFTDSANNQVSGFHQGAMDDFESQDLNRWAGQNILVMLSPHNPDSMRAHVAECEQFGLRFIYDPGQHVSSLPAEDLRVGMNGAEVLIVNEYELSLLSKRTDISIEDIKSKVPIVVTTLGENGSIVEGAKIETPITIGAAQPEKIIDPTGAGDAYRAGFLYGYVRDWSLEQCGRLGATVASFIVEDHGAQIEISKDEILSRYQQNFNEEINL